MGFRVCSAGAGGSWPGRDGRGLFVRRFPGLGVGSRWPRSPLPFRGLYLPHKPTTGRWGVAARPGCSSLENLRSRGSITPRLVQLYPEEPRPLVPIAVLRQDHRPAVRGPRYYERVIRRFRKPHRGHRTVRGRREHVRRGGRAATNSTRPTDRRAKPPAPRAAARRAEIPEVFLGSRGGQNVGGVLT